MARHRMPLVALACCVDVLLRAADEVESTARTSGWHYYKRRQPKWIVSEAPNAVEIRQLACDVRAIASMMLAEVCVPCDDTLRRAAAVIAGNARRIKNLHNDYSASEICGHVVMPSPHAVRFAQYQQHEAAILSISEWMDEQ